jgi:hypothetical protein
MMPAGSAPIRKIKNNGRMACQWLSGKCIMDPSGMFAKYAGIMGGTGKMNTLFTLETTAVKPLNEILHSILTFIYFLAHQIGLGLVKAVQTIIPGIAFPSTIADPLGFLVILTLFMLLVSVELGKKIAWIIIAAGWILLLIRILMIIFKIG